MVTEALPTLTDREAQKDARAQEKSHHSLKGPESTQFLLNKSQYLKTKIELIKKTFGISTVQQGAGQESKWVDMHRAMSITH